MRTLLRRLFLGVAFLLTTAAVMVPPRAAVAALFNVYVGYADGLRSNGFFPNPWQGDAGVTFLGFSQGNAFDAGAIMIQNTSGASLLINSIAVSINGTGVAPGWTLPQTIAPGNFLIVTQTSDFNFDTSDIHTITPFGVPVTDCLLTCPVINIAVNNGVGQDFKDTTHVLDTLGYDFAADGSNESFRWRLIGEAAGCTGPACGANLGQTPIPGALPLFASGLGALGLFGWRKRRVSKRTT